MQKTTHLQLHLVTNVTNGTLTLNANGTFSYVHNDSETTTDSFTHKANDGTSYSNVVTLQSQLQLLIISFTPILCSGKR
jgi:VCBS repeat-containing protein